jgi:hypothetical protein
MKPLILEDGKIEMKNAEFDSSVGSSPYWLARREGNEDAATVRWVDVMGMEAFPRP